MSAEVVDGATRVGQHDGHVSPAEELAPRRNETALHNTIPMISIIQEAMRDWLP